LALCIHTFRFQYDQNPVYRQWCDLTGVDPDTVKTHTSIPALPISFFKTHAVKTTDFVPGNIFESSGTTKTNTSKHLVKEVDLYRQSFLKAFTMFYGDVKDWCILGLLPSYLERQHSSLVMMVDELIQQSGHPSSGFYLDEHQKLSEHITGTGNKRAKDLTHRGDLRPAGFYGRFPQQLKHTIIMETGGMKGRRKELTRAEVHSLLKKGTGVDTIHSEYGMTELLSQAYSSGNGRFTCPPWMKVMVRDEEDPYGSKRGRQGHFAGNRPRQPIQLCLYSYGRCWNGI
jgi:hypothetical protein